MSLEEFLLKFPRFTATPLAAKLNEMGERGRKHAAFLNLTHEKMRDDKADFEHADAEFKALERAAEAGKLTKVTNEKDKSGKNATFIDTDSARLAASRSVRDRAESAYRATRTQYESLRKNGCGDAAVLHRVLGYLVATPAARKAIYATYGV